MTGSVDPAEQMGGALSSGLRRVRSFWQELLDARYVLAQLVAQQLILRYRRTALGYLWTLINPLLMMTVMAVVFSTLFRVELKTFAIFLFAGMVPWNFISLVVGQSGAAFLNSEGLIKKIYLPKALFPLSINLALLLDSVLSFFALFLIILAIGAPLTWAVLFIPVAYVLLLILALGVSMLISLASVFFRDLQYIMGIVMQGLFFLTPILYKPESLAGKVAWLVALNPLTSFIELFRAPLIHGSIPSLEVIFRSLITALLVFALGLYVFMRKEKEIVFRL